MLARPLGSSKAFSFQALVPVAVALALVLGSTPASAAPDASRQLILDFLTSWKSDYESVGQLSWDELKVSAESAGDLVVVPNLLFSVDDSAIKFGTIEFVVADAPPAPSGKPRQRLSMTLPKAISIKGKAPNDMIDIGIANNRFSGTWAPEFHNFVDVDGLWEGLTLVGKGEAEGKLQVGSIAITTKGAEKGELWDGVTKFSMKSFKLTSKDVAVAFNEFSETIAGENVAIGPWSELGRQFKTLTKTGDASGLDADDGTKLLDTLAALPALADKLGGDMTLTGLEASTTPQQRFSMEKFVLDGGFTRTGGGKADVAFGFGFNGVKAPGLPIPTPELVPDRAKLALSMIGVPSERLFEALIKAGREANQSSADDGKDSLMAEAMEIAQSSNTTLKLAFNLGAAKLTADMTSDFKIDAAAAMGVVGTAKMVVAGLDPVIDAARKKPKNPELDQILTGLSFVKGMGSASAANGAVVYNYLFEVNQAGAMTLNGQDLQQLMSK